MVIWRVDLEIKKIKIWDIDSGSEIITLSEHIIINDLIIIYLYLKNLFLFNSEKCQFLNLNKKENVKF